MAVSEVEENSKAGLAQLRPGQVIYRVEGQRVRTPKEFYQRVANLRGPVKLLTDQGEITVE